MTTLLLWSALALMQPAGDCCDEPKCCDDPNVIIVPPIYVAPPPLAARLVPPKKREDRFLFKIALGGAYEHLFGESAGGASVDVELGAEDLHWGGGLQLQLIGGRLSSLDFTWFRWGPGFEWMLGQRARFGIGMGFGLLSIYRVGFGDTMRSFSFGGRLDLTVDLAGHVGRNALFLGASVGADGLFDVTNLSNAAFQLSLGLGYRG
jgi:hypothetical protein